MEVFVDFGLFEVLIASGLAALAVRIYGRPSCRAACLLLSVASPALLVYLVDAPLERALAVLALATALVNAAFILRVAAALPVPAAAPLPAATRAPQPRT